jgi:predicted HicB family RNase H-like nuclease
VIEYKGYFGVFEYDPDEEAFHGHVVNLAKDGITFAGKSVEELAPEMAAGIDDYLAFCADRGEKPDRPIIDKSWASTSAQKHTITSYLHR